jgi:DNA invertase Pin-like site-specific DNA recombinase
MLQQDVIAEFVEVASGAGADAIDKRPELAAALTLSHQTGSTLVVSRLDRLSRSVAFIAMMMESKINFAVAEYPGAEPFMLHILASVAEEERRKTSQRTCEALAVKKAQGFKLGNPRPAASLEKGRAVCTAKADLDAKRVAGAIASAKANGCSTLQAIASELNRMEISAPRGGAWFPNSVRNAILRLEQTPAIAEGHQLQLLMDHP